MRFITSVIHKVTDIKAASSFFTLLGFEVKQKTSDWVILENGAVSLRLIASDGIEDIDNNLNLELTTKILDEDTNELLSYPGVSLIEKHICHSPERIENRIQCPHNLIISLIREFDEDELGIIPPLPTSLYWETEAEECVKQLLRIVPLSFRQNARIRITEKAEMVTASKGTITVTINDAVQALAEATPHFQHRALKEALIERGIDPLNYFVINDL